MTKGEEIAGNWITNEPHGNVQRIALAAEIDAALAESAKATEQRAVGKKLSDAPCDQCGYNGRGYYQPDTHSCARTTPGTFRVLNEADFRHEEMIEKLDRIIELLEHSSNNRDNDN